MLPKSQVKVVVVDDSLGIAAYHKDILECEGFQEVREFHDPKELIALAEQGSFIPDIVVSDFDMGCEINGVTLLNSLSKLNPLLKAMIVTGSPKEVSQLTKQFPILDKNNTTARRIVELANQFALEFETI